MIHMLKYVFLNKVKNNNVKVFDSISDVNEAKYLFMKKSCDCKCRLDENACNSKPKFL